MYSYSFVPKAFARLAAIGIARRLATMFLKYAG